MSIVEPRCSLWDRTTMDSPGNCITSSIVTNGNALYCAIRPEVNGNDT